MKSIIVHTRQCRGRGIFTQNIIIRFCYSLVSFKSLYRNNEDSFVDNLMLGVQLADVSTRCSSHPQGKSEARCEIDGNL